MKFPQMSGKIALVILPLSILVLIAIYGVNVPFWDEWFIQAQFLTLEKHPFATFFEQSNESRLIVPKLIFLGVSKFLGWQPKHYMYFGWLIVLGIFFMIYRLCYLRPARGRAQDGLGLLCLACTSALFFSPAASENWLWGIQWVIFVPLACALVAFDLQRRTRSFGIRLGITVLLNVVAMFSFSNGMLLWAVSFPFWREVLEWIAGRRRSKGAIIRWLGWSLGYGVMAVIFVCIYFTDYKNTSTESPLVFALKEPWSVVKYFAAWCGGPIHLNGMMHIIVGFTLLLAVVASAAWVIRLLRRHSGRRSYLYLSMFYPSVLIIVYALASGMMTSLVRASFGIEQAYSSRYLFHSGALWVGLIAALNTHRGLAFWARPGGDAFRRAFPCVLLVFSILVGRTWYHFARQFNAQRMGRQQILLNVRMLGFAPKGPMLERTAKWLDLPSIVKNLTEKGLYDSSPYGDWLVESLKHPRSEGGGRVQVVVRPNREIAVAGWAINPEKDRPADSVLICRRGPNGQLEPFIMVAAGFKNREAVQATGKSSLKMSGFMEAFPWPEGDIPTSAEMFAVDERARTLYSLAEKP